MPVNPKQFALYERDQRVNEQPAVYTSSDNTPEVKSQETTNEVTTQQTEELSDDDLTV